jgi:hypothetical protein
MPVLFVIMIQTQFAIGHEIELSTSIKTHFSDL